METDKNIAIGVPNDENIKQSIKLFLNDKR